ncbi:MAG: lipoyl synthase [Acidimicrobiales bacterium]
MSARGRELRVRWLGRVRYRDAHALQEALKKEGAAEYLLLLEHPHVYTLGVRARTEHVLVDPESVGAELVHADRGGDVTYHGPGQLVGYPILNVPMGLRAVPAHVHAIEQLVIDALGDLGLGGLGRLAGYPGVWVDPAGSEPRKLCAIGVRIDRGRSMHGFALNVDPDLSMFGHIVPCGLSDLGVTSLAAEGLNVAMQDAVEAIVRRAPDRLVPGASIERQDASWWPGPARSVPPFSVVDTFPSASRALDRRLVDAGVDPGQGVALSSRKPEWARAEARIGPELIRLRATMRELDLVTVCEEAGCPNIFECWADGTATFMINGERCTRACGFCLVDTRRPLPLDPGEPDRVAEAVARLRLTHAVVTAVARDDLGDGGAQAFAETIAAIRRRSPGATVEVLIPDCKGDEASLNIIFEARPDVLNHNLETVNRLQRAVRPSASYARSLSVLARAAAAGCTTKSGIILGMGETVPEVVAALGDLRAVGVEIVTLGQYLRPTAAHLPVARWWAPAEFEELAEAARAMGIAHVEASPLTRSSYHAKRAVVASGLAGAVAETADVS